jgi:hypothetical protein
MANRIIAVPREKCLDCVHFIRQHLLSRKFTCRFDLIPFVANYGTDKEPKLMMACGCYQDNASGKDAPAHHLYEKMKKKFSPTRIRDKEGRG